VQARLDRPINVEEHAIQRYEALELEGMRALVPIVAQPAVATARTSNKKSCVIYKPGTVVDWRPALCDCVCVLLRPSDHEMVTPIRHFATPPLHKQIYSVMEQLGRTLGTFTKQNLQVDPPAGGSKASKHNFQAQHQGSGIPTPGRYVNSKFLRQLTNICNFETGQGQGFGGREGVDVKCCHRHGASASPSPLNVVIDPMVCSENNSASVQVVTQQCRLQDTPAKPAPSFQKAAGAVATNGDHLGQRCDSPAKCHGVCEATFVY